MKGSHTAQATSSNSKQPKLDELPLEIIGEIVGKLDLMDRLKTRKVCRIMRAANSEMTQKVQLIELQLSGKQIDLCLDDTKVQYYGKEDGRCNVYKDALQITLPDNCLTRAIEDLKTVMKIPKIKIEKLSIVSRRPSGTDDILQMLQEIRNHSNREFHVEFVHITTDQIENILPILRLMNARVLKKIVIFTHGRNIVTDISELIATEQFRNATHLTISEYADLDANLIFDPSFQSFEIFRIRVTSMTLDQILRLQDMLTGSAHFKECTIFVILSLQPIFGPIRRALGEPPNDDDNQYSLRHRREIPNSDGCYLDFNIRHGVINVTRHRKNGRRYDDDGDSDYEI